MYPNKINVFKVATYVKFHTFTFEKLQFLITVSPRLVSATQFTKETSDEMTRSYDAVAWDVWSERVVSQCISD